MSRAGYIHMLQATEKWLVQVDYDLATAEYMLHAGRYIDVVFFWRGCYAICQLSICGGCRPPLSDPFPPGKLCEATSCTAQRLLPVGVRLHTPRGPLR